jgi:hypothetical protein
MARSRNRRREAVNRLFSGMSENGRQATLGIVNGTAAGLSLSVLVNASERPVIFASGIVLAISLFILRREIRWLYGLIEISFGLYVLWDASGKGRGAFSSDFSDAFSKFQLAVVVIQTLGAIYVLIRGMDNFAQGYPSLRAAMMRLCDR